MILHKKAASLNHISEEDAQPRLTQLLGKAKPRSKSVPFITVTQCNESEIYGAVSEQEACPTPSAVLMEFSLKTRKQSYARRSMRHRFSSISDGVWSVLETTANVARNTLKVPSIWEWKGASPRKEQLGEFSEKKSLEEDDGAMFPYAGNWETGARYRYYYRTAPVGPGFVAVGRRETVGEKRIFSPDLAQLAAGRKGPDRAIAVTKSGKIVVSGRGSAPSLTKMRAAAALFGSPPESTRVEEKEDMKVELERLLLPYGGF